MTRMMRQPVPASLRSGCVGIVSIALLGLASVSASGAEPDKSPDKSSVRRDLLTERQWERLDVAVDKGLKYLATQQSRKDGSFAAPALGQPGITSLCVLAFLSRGHAPQDGPHSVQLDRAIDFVLKTQQKNGLLFDMPVGNQWEYGTPTHTGIYNHAIAGLMLAEVHGMADPRQSTRIDSAITSAVQFTLDRQRTPKRNAADEGGWRYLRGSTGLRSDADLSITSWQLMFLRSARNNGFEVPVDSVDQALGYVRRSFDRNKGAFKYGQLSPGNHSTRAVVGSGVLSLSLGGEHQTEIAKAAGDWILQHPFDRYNRVEYHEERYHYSAFYCSQAMFQLGGDYWARFFPPFMRVLLENQQPDGSWPAESNRDGHFGSAYTTALVILALTPPYQLLPIYQR